MVGGVGGVGLGQGGLQQVEPLLLFPLFAHLTAEHTKGLMLSRYSAQSVISKNATVEFSTILKAYMMSIID